MSKLFYSEEYQVKVLAYELANPQFCGIAKDTIELEHFGNRALQWYHSVLTNASIPLSPATLKEEMMAAVDNGSIKESEVDKIAGYYNYVVKPPLPVEQEHIQKTFEKFIRTQAMKQAILNSMDLIKAEQWDEVVGAVEEARNKGIDILTTGHNFFGDFERRLIERINREEVRRIPTGIPALDEITNGGIKNKQLGIVIGGTGRGKSIFLEWLSKVAILLGKQVIYYSLEMSEEDIADRFDSLFCHIKPQELHSMNTELYKELHPLASKFGNNLIIKGYPEDEATVHTFKSHYKQLASIGVVPDLMVIDYLDLMKPHRTYHDQNAEQTAVVKAVRGLSKSLDTRIWSALQLNRGGMVQETPDETGVAGSVARIFTADMAIFMAQTKEEREEEIMRLFVAKNRNGISPRTVKISTDYGHMTFYRPDAQLDAENKKALEKPVAPAQDEVEIPAVDLAPDGTLVLD